MNTDKIKGASWAFNGYLIAFCSSLLTLIGATVWSFTSGSDWIVKIAELSASGVEITNSMAIELAQQIIPSMGILVIILFITYSGYVVGVALVYAGIKKLSNKFDEYANSSLRTMSTGALLVLIAAACSLIGSFVPLIAILAPLCGLVGIIILLSGASGLKKAAALSDEGRAGAKKIFTAYILLLCIIGAVFIPIIGWLAIPVLWILSVVFELIGWASLKRSFVLENQQQQY